MRSFTLISSDNKKQKDVCFNENSNIVRVDTNECITPTAPPSDNSIVEETLPPSNKLEIHFLDVGQGDSTLVLCDGHSMLIDGGYPSESSLIYSYLKRHGVTHIDYLICTHPHDDHVGGLSGALNYATVGTAYCSSLTYSSGCFSDFIKYLDLQHASISIPAIGTEFSVGEAKCTVIGVNTLGTDDLNNSSIVIKMEYCGTSFLFSGDAGKGVEETILDAGYDIKSTVIKVPHHGSDTALCSRWLEAADPDFAVISVGKDNSYGHPSDITLQKLNDAGVTLFRTDMQGHIVCYCDGTSVEFEVERNPDINTLITDRKPSP